MSRPRTNLKLEFVKGLAIGSVVFTAMILIGLLSIESISEFMVVYGLLLPGAVLVWMFQYYYRPQLGQDFGKLGKAAKLGKSRVIAVDGPTASGKGTIAKAIAEHFELPYLDTGLLYRAVGYQTVAEGGDPDNPADALAACDFRSDLLRANALRSEEVGGYASRASVHPQVRQALLERQRAFAAQPGGAVLDGRDIGTVIAPEADVKLFVTASVQERAKRRWMEMQGREIDVPLVDIERDIAARDARDINRADAPLRAAPDALVIDTTAFGKEEAIETAIEAVTQALR